MEQFLNGLLWGAGLMVAVICLSPVYWWLHRVMHAKMMDSLKELGSMFDDEDDPYEDVSFGPEIRLLIQEVRVEREDDIVRVFGKLNNESDYGWDCITLHVNMFDRGDTFIGQYVTDVEGAMYPEQSRHFQREFEVSDQFDHLTIEVAEALYIGPPSESVSEN